MRRLYPDVSPTVDVEAAYEHAPGLVRGNMVASADGAATLEGRSGGLSSQSDHRLFLTLRTFSDVVLVGASTVRAENYGPAKFTAEARERRVSQGLAPIPPVAVVTASLDLDPAARFFTEAVVRPIIITIDDADPGRRAALEAVAEVIPTGHTRADLPRALDILAERGMTRVLTEGGPALLSELATAGRLNDLCLTVSPVLAGGHSKRILDGPALPQPTRLSLVHVLEDDGSLFLRYSAG